MVIPGEVFFHNQLAETPADAQTARILIVDDDVSLRRTLPHILAAPHREFDTADCVHAAIAQLEAGIFDLIVLDYRLPDATGLAVLDWLSEHERDEAVIMISGEDAIDAVIGALRRGADDYVRKPYHVAQLQRAVQNALHKRMLERANRAMGERLRASERLHRFLVESSPDLIFTLDAQGRFNYVNPRIEELLGFRRNHLLNQPFASLVLPEDSDRIASVLQAQHTRPDTSFTLELRLRKATDTAAGVSGHLAVALQGIPMLGRGEGGEGGYVGLYGIARDISERKRAEEIISFQAYHDQLTRLPNRVLFRDRLDLALTQARRRSGSLAVLYVDIDRFKLVNDTYGHSEGDALIRGVAARLSATLRRSDTLARVGGDEFTILLPDIGGVEDAEHTARKIQTSLEAPLALTHGDFRATVSVGIAIYPADGETCETLMQHADIAMYQVKRSGKNGYRFFAPELNTRHQGRIAIENDLRVALKLGQLELHYQPQVSLSQRRVVGVEALLRWNHPDDGLISPAIFIPIAEELGLIGEISRWVLEQACAQLAAWQKRGHDNVKMSLNLAAYDFDRGDIVAEVTDCIARHGLPPGQITLEITEHMMMQDTPGVTAKVRRLREAGVGIAIDDFGTGYSALAYLQKLPISALKIDRSFVKDLGGLMTNPIISAIIGIARGFDLDLIAEGVEHAQQAAMLRALGCDVMQGYYFARPVQADDAEALFSMPPRSVSG
ncbi:putative bifunctional diguanylate cyclase/phosphodiesterase [Pseudazoarcus pumilus]|uniref:Two-component system response regulator n=1 Tax=Pseudazoarcus pumilus TaxID=2067960 RepID=A0A2I6S3V3_9RHOO|nr:EAL domain-containing protein [Pseudazoarcus pumilus]AUN93932.1 two-component system response regulator [Pseudazoarcus pumilus]